MAGAASVWRSVIDRVLFGTTIKARRNALRQTLLANAAYGCIMIMHIFEVRYRLMAMWQLVWLASACTVFCWGFYLLIRTGINERFKSPTLAVPQQLFATVAIVWTYGISGSDRGVAIGLLVLVLLFGAFAFRVRQTVEMAGTMLAMLAATMVLRHRQDPADFPAAVEAADFMYACVIIWLTCVLTLWTGQLQKAYAAQKKALKQALEQIQRLAESDDLTGLINRRAMVPLMRAQMEARHPVEGQICLILIDLDWFKSVNDKYGHQAGDETLRLFADTGKATLRAGDMFARWGGEEFLLMLPNCSAAQGCECMERMRAALAAANFDFVCPGFKLTISAGVTTLRQDDRLETALERADQAMYHAKQMGRDQVVVSGEHPAACGEVAKPEQINAA